MLLSGDCQCQPRQLAVCVQLTQSAFSNQRAARRNHRERAAGLLDSTARFLHFTTPQDVRRNPCTERSGQGSENAEFWREGAVCTTDNNRQDVHDCSTHKRTEDGS